MATGVALKCTPCSEAALYLEDHGPSGQGPYASFSQTSQVVDCHAVFGAIHNVK